MRYTRTQSGLRATVKSHGGVVRFLYKVLRLLSCLALLGITITAFILLPSGQSLAETADVRSTSSWIKKPKKPRGGKGHHAPLTLEEWQELSLFVFFVSLAFFLDDERI